MKTATRKTPKKRCGIALLIVVTALAIATGLCHTLVRFAVLRHRAIDRELEQAQVRALAEAGLHRATAALARDENWTGETWKPEIPNGSGGAGRIATVAIRSQARDDRSRQVVAEAALGEGRDTRKVVRNAVISLRKRSREETAQR
jgi:type II secretory pathway component PulK